MSVCPLSIVSHGICLTHALIFTEILCEKIRVPDNSKLLFLSAGLTPGSLTTYKCVPGYTIATGSNETRCTPKGQWDSPLPNCTSTSQFAFNCAVSLRHVKPNSYNVCAT